MNQFWTEDPATTEFQVPDRVLDVSYRIECKCLPNEHAHALSEALHQALPWLAEEEGAGIHQIHGAESGNGWERPETGLLYVSRRQKLILRLPRDRLAQAGDLVGQTLDVAGYPLTVGEYTTRKLSDLSTLFARQVIAEAGQDEEAFLGQVAAQLAEMGIPVRKLLCSKEGRIALPDATLFTRGLMVADLEPEEAVLLQEQGLGPGRKLGCGLFLPQKGIRAVNPD
ncbi:MAG TPA: type I-MYXAN CRISPR-associated protein Cas6/Cmx6 [Chromatiales bacterium]|nr:type I-MYXAN CRISPR-associated protein Cas6/Cmx6 [Chromatiales bacterium]